VLLSDNPNKACSGNYVTPHYLRMAYGARQGCIDAGSPSGAIAIGFVSYEAHVQGSQATVQVRPQGGLYKGEKLTLSLVKEGGDWKVDSLKSNAPVGP
jgi:hypothetical protein